LIHPSAIVDPAAELHESVSVGPYSIIGPGVTIDAETEIGPHVVVRGQTRIGRSNRIFQFASVGDEPQDKKYSGEPTRLEIGDGNTIRECCTLNRGTAQDEGVTRIGNRNWLMAYVHVAHDCVIGDDNVFANNVTLAGHVQVGDSTVLGGFSGVHQFCQIGSYAMLGMFSGLTRDVPAYFMVSGQPAVPRGINAEGMRRHGFDGEQIRALRRAYRTIYRSGMKLADAVAEIEVAAAERAELRPLVDSLRRSTRSIVR
jgi:UDP-N-acetylglucosamine acyltransferase